MEHVAHALDAEFVVGEFVAVVQGGELLCDLELVVDDALVFVAGAIEDVERDGAGGEGAANEAIVVELQTFRVDVTPEKTHVDAIDDGVDVARADGAVQGTRFERCGKGVDDRGGIARRLIQPIGPVRQPFCISGALVEGDVELLHCIEVGRCCHGSLLESFK